MRQSDTVHRSAVILWWGRGDPSSYKLTWCKSDTFCKNIFWINTLWKKMEFVEKIQIFGKISQSDTVHGSGIILWWGRGDPSSCKLTWCGRFLDFLKKNQIFLKVLKVLKYLLKYFWKNSDTHGHTDTQCRGVL